MARNIVENVGIPLELDTDGIWCMLPADFPIDVQFESGFDKPITLEYSTTIFNARTAKFFSNDQF